MLSLFGLPSRKAMWCWKCVHDVSDDPGPRGTCLYLFGVHREGGVRNRREDGPRTQGHFSRTVYAIKTLKVVINYS